MSEKKRKRGNNETTTLAALKAGVCVYLPESTNTFTQASYVCLRHRRHFTFSSRASVSTVLRSRWRPARRSSTPRPHRWRADHPGWEHSATLGWTATLFGSAIRGSTCLRSMAKRSAASTNSIRIVLVGTARARAINLLPRSTTHENTAEGRSDTTTNPSKRRDKFSPAYRCLDDKSLS